MIGIFFKKFQRYFIILDWFFIRAVVICYGFRFQKETFLNFNGLQFMYTFSLDNYKEKRFGLSLNLPRNTLRTFVQNCNYLSSPICRSCGDFLLCLRSNSWFWNHLLPNPLHVNIYCPCSVCHVKEKREPLFKFLHHLVKTQSNKFWIQMNLFFFNLRGKDIREATRLICYILIFFNTK